MAENPIAEKNSNAKGCTKKSTRVDLTPMVDLGFLLITFFVFTSTISKATAMDMNSPDDKEPKINDLVCESCAITVIPVGDNKLYYYEGDEKTAVYRLTDYSSTGLRALLVRKKKEVAALKRDAVLIIKPSSVSTFKNLVNIIDESNIAMYPKYYLDNLSPADIKHTASL